MKQVHTLFYFRQSFKEMLANFTEHHPSLLIANNKKVPYDWTIYYLRKKALTQKISVKRNSLGFF